MMYWAWLFVWQLPWLAALGVPRDLYHTHSNKWISHDEPENGYFGFSIAYEPTSKRLIISAPQHDDMGEVYSCDIATSSCLSVAKGLKFVNTVKRAEKHYRWFGATVKAGNSFFVVCAPRHLEIPSFKIPGVKKADIGTFSTCYKYENVTYNTPPRLLKSFTETQRKGPGVKHLEHYMNSLGWSVDIYDSKILIGGPAMYTGRTIMHFDDPSYEPARLSGYSFKKDQQVNYNFGYSVLMGYFSKSDEKTLYYAVSSPYGTTGKGKILFYYTKPYSALMIIADYLETDDEFGVGSMYGAELAGARLTENSDLTWLLVGAPTFADTKLHVCNQGAVYIYQPDENIPPKLFKKIVGIKDDSFFGSAIISLGDFNGDGMDEIAIAAPYEDSGVGAVYLYSSKDIKNTEIDTVPYMQRISPEPTDTIKSFGRSLTSIQDYDENGCNELAIGAPESNRVMVLRCIAFVTVKLYEVIPDLNKNRVKTDADNKFTFQSCLETKFPLKPVKVTGSINVTVELTLQETKLEITPKTYQIDISSKEPHICKNIVVVAPKNGNFEYPIRYSVKAEDNNPAELMNEFDPSKVALSDRSVLQSSGNIWFSDCADVENCDPKLILHPYFPSSGYMIGSMDAIELKASVTNEGEAAYGACVRMKFRGTSVTVVPIGCEHEPHTSEPYLVCKPDVALRKNAWDLPTLSLETSHLTSNDKTIGIEIGVFDHCMRRKEGKWQNETIALMSDTNLKIKAMTDLGKDHNVNMTKDDETGKPFEHNYFITNDGVTNWVNLIAQVDIQKRPFIVYNPIIISPSKNPSPCKSLSNITTDNGDLERFHCTIDQVYHDPVKITIPMEIQFGTLENAISEKINTQFTSVTLKLNGDGEEIKASETSQLNFGGKIAIWIIVVAVLVGILILVLFCLLLTKCGFFKRKDKESLQRVRQSVRRQTMVRRTMMEGVRTQLESDRRSLLASLSEETAEQAAARDRRLRLDSNATRKK